MSKWAPKASVPIRGPVSAFKQTSAVEVSLVTTGRLSLVSKTGFALAILLPPTFLKAEVSQPRDSSKVPETPYTAGKLEVFPCCRILTSENTSGYPVDNVV